MTLGEDRVRVKFNPSADSDVEIIKSRYADLIDKIEQLRMEGKDPRLCAIAQTSTEEAAMWAVKAATSEARVEVASSTARPR